MWASRKFMEGRRYEKIVKQAKKKKKKWRNV